MKKLQQKLEALQNELYDLHFTEPSSEVYKQRRSDLEFQIFIIEEAIEHEKKMLPIKLSFIIAVIAMGAILIYSLLK
jgi:cob(I)alamin adenosyltransferase